MRNPIFIIAGHNIRSKGALAYNGKWEHDYTTDLQDRVVKSVQACVSLCGTSIDIETDEESLANREIVSIINTNSGKESFGIDIHFNKNNPKATGVEVILHKNTNEINKKRATWIVNEIAKCLELPLRRRVSNRDYITIEETYLGSQGKDLPILTKTRIPFMILEICFLNENDLNKYHGKENQVAEIIRKGILKKF
jgi:N-acetylmuramoyl-L-alanine amidase